jgi:uncharacterized protein YacL
MISFFSTASLSDLSLFLVILIISIVMLVVTRRLLHVSFPYFFMGTVGVILGLVIGSTLGNALSALPGDFGRWLPIIVTVFITVGTLDLFIAQTRPVAQYFERTFSKVLAEAPADRIGILIDTSVLVDGRIEELADTGFIVGDLVIPLFVLQELQKIADSSDAMKRSRGRRGLDVLSSLQKNSHITVEISQDRILEKDQVDNKLVRVAKRRGLRLMTVDYNLARVAQIQGVEVLNINELAAAIRPLLIPGEAITVKVVQKGKEKNQGVGYLPDGTMIVVEGGDKYVGSDVECEVTRIFQTVAGKMIFVQPKGSPTKEPVYEKVLKSWEKELNT